MSKLLERRLGTRRKSDSGLSISVATADAKAAAKPSVVLVNQGRRKSEPTLGSLPDAETRPASRRLSKSRETSPGSPKSLSPVSDTSVWSSPTSSTSAWFFSPEFWSSSPVEDKSPQNKRGGSLRRNSLSLTGSLALAGTQGNISVVDLDDKQEQRMFHRLRRGLGGRPLNFYELADHATEQIISTPMDTPWPFKACVKSATCQRICFPADYATRKTQKQDNNLAGAHVTTLEVEGHSDLQGMLGFPSMESSGYELMNDRQAAVRDPQVSAVLGLHKAVHRITSVERFCCRRPKSMLPSGGDRQTLKHHLDNLQALDHMNILRCHEIYEDADMLYLMYEFFPCVTLASIIEQIMWTQKQQVNLVRECIAAVAHAGHEHMTHLGWTHWHVLLPASCMNGEPDLEGAKVFGFGLNGMVHMEASVNMFWAPEAVQQHKKYGDSFAWRLPTSLKHACDCWSLGAFTYCVIARRPPFVGPAKTVTDLILLGRWDFTVAFDLVGMEAKKLVEGLMQLHAEHRMTAEAALRAEWIRRHASFDAKRAGHLFAKAEEFVTSSLPKRLFGRFLVKHLDADHLRKIAQVVNALDCNGDGKICTQDLKMAAKHAGRPSTAIQTVFSWFVPDSHEGRKMISALCFAESMAEDVIDGKAMRHAFESLDEDGSECISADELHASLKILDPDLTLDEIVQHIELAEEDVGGEGEAGSDHMIDFSEFCALFPVRTQRLKNLEERRKGVEAQGVRLDGQLCGLAPQAAQWISILRKETEQLHVLQSTEIDNDRLKAVKAMKESFRRISKTLRNPPGPGDSNKLLYRMTKLSSKRQKAQKSRHNDEVYGYDSFLQDRAVEEAWAHLLNSEIKILEREVVTKDEDGKNQVDHFKALDIAERVEEKVKELLSWTAVQHEEYKSFVEVLDSSLEAPIPTVPYSTRGLREHAADEDSTNDWGFAEQDGSSAFTHFCNDVYEDFTNLGRMVS